MQNALLKSYSVSTSSDGTCTLVYNVVAGSDTKYYPEVKAIAIQNDSATGSGTDSHSTVLVKVNDEIEVTFVAQVRAGSVSEPTAAEIADGGPVIIINDK